MKFLNTPIKMIFILFSSMVMGIILLYLVFLIPTGPVYSHVKNTVHVFEIEGTYPAMEGKISKILDNWTDTLMLGNAIYEKKDTKTLQKALDIYRPSYKDSTPTDSLIAYINGVKGEEITSYPRYWHGYLVFLKPLLSITDYLGFRSINKIAVMTLTLLVLAVMHKCRHRRLIIPFLVAVFFLRPEAIAYSLQFSTIYYITLIAILVSMIWNHRLRRGNGYLYFFFIIGILTSYLDLLTYPSVTLGIPLVAWLAMQEELSYMEKIKKTVVYAFTWAWGYFGMWVEKWLAASVLLHRNIFKDAINQAQMRLSDHSAEAAFTRSDVIVRNLYFGFSDILIPACIVLVALCIFVILKYSKSIKMFSLHVIPYILVSVIPFAWYIVLGNHSFIHTWFTYRTLAITVFSILCVGNIKFSEEITHKNGHTYIVGS